MIRSLFPSMVYQAPLSSSVRALNRDLLRETYQLADVDDEGLKWSQKNYRGGYTSYGSMDQLHQFSTTFENLRKAIDRHVAKYVHALEMEIDLKELRMNSCWVNIMPSEVIHTMHLHPLSVISGTYYVQTPPKGGTLKFEDPRMACFMAAPPRKATAKMENQNFFHLKPKAGEVVLFESWMRHEVPANADKKDRISISFNYDWIRR